MTLPIEHANPTRKIFRGPISTKGKQAIERPAMMTHRVPTTPRATRLDKPNKESLCDRYATPGASTICMAEGSTMTHAACAGSIPKALIK